MEILDFVFYTLGVVALIEIALRVFASYYLKEESNDPVSEKIEENVIFGWVEEINGTFYVYNMLNNAFVGQGKTAEDFKNMSERVGKQVIVMDGQPEAFEKLVNTAGIKEFRVSVK